VAIINIINQHLGGMCVEINRNKSKFVFGLGELVRQTDSVNTLNLTYLYCLNEIK